MTPTSRVQIRALVVLGFSLSALAGVVNYVFSVSTGGYRFDSFQTVVDPLLLPLTSIAAIVAWYWLTQVEPRDPSQLRVLRRAYQFFAIEYVLIAASFNFIFTPIHNFGSYWITFALWMDLLGALTAALGLFLTSRSLAIYGEPEVAMVDVGGAV
jgi:hypothetical protein